MKLPDEKDHEREDTALKNDQVIPGLPKAAVGTDGLNEMTSGGLRGAGQR